MQEIQLYIEGKRVDMFKDESVTITQSIKNVKDIGKVFTAFTKTFNLPASKTNNRIFKHYYNFDIVDGFDARKRVSSNIELNHLPFTDGRLKLEGVGLKNNLPHTYKVTFFGSTVTLKDLLGDDELSGLDLSAYDTLYQISEVTLASKTDPETTDLIVPLITHTQRLYYDSGNSFAEDGNLHYINGLHKGVWWNQLKYALRIDFIIRAIEGKYNITFSNDFFNNTNKHYYNLFMWLHRKKGAVENLTDANQDVINGWTGTLGNPDPTLTQMVNNRTLRVTGDVLKYNLYSLTLTTATSVDYKISIQKDGVEVYSSGILIGSKTFDQTDFNLEQGDYTVYIESKNDILFSNIEWEVYYQGVVSPSNYPTGTYNFVSLFYFIISQQIPKMKVIDFLSGLFKMFNLTAYYNGTELVVKTLDDYYASGISYDVTEYVDVKKSAVNVALPFKEISLEHEDTNTLIAKVHEQKFGKTWGKSEYTSGEQLDGGKYEIKTPFAQMKYERLKNTSTDTNTTIQVGLSVEDLGDGYLGKPLLFYPILQEVGSSTSISVLVGASNNIIQTSYVIPSNSVSLLRSSSTENMNFYNENNEYTGSADFVGTLFEKYYKKYIGDVFNPKNRITKVTAYLPLRILLNYTLADRFIIGGHSYKINSIKTNLKNGKSDLELLNDL